jgi:septal ring factor EnvC (AmiA/AmiB activator)
MNSISDRLRRDHPQSDEGALRHEAADEIARLTAEVAEQVKWVSDLADSLSAEEAKTARLTAENEKLRAALALFACDCKGEELCFNTDNCRNFIARAALTQSAPEKGGE